MSTQLVTLCVWRNAYRVAMWLCHVSTKFLLSTGAAVVVDSNIYFPTVNIKCMRDEADTSSPFIWQAVICVIQPIRALHDMTSYNTPPSSHHGIKQGNAIFIYIPLLMLSHYITVMNTTAYWTSPDCTTGMNERNQRLLFLREKEQWFNCAYGWNAWVNARMVISRRK